MSHSYAEVSLPPPIARELSYAVPEALEWEIELGTLVLVPVARQMQTGVVIALHSHPPDGLKAEQMRPIAQILDSEPLLAPELIELCRWMADYYFSPLGSALAAALPPGVQLTSRRQVQLSEDQPADRPADDVERRVLEQLDLGRPLQVTTLRRRLGRDGLEGALQRLKRGGYVDVRPVLKTPKVKTLHEQYVRLASSADVSAALEEIQRRAPRQAACLSLLVECGPAAKKTLVDQGFGYPILKSLEGRGLIETFASEVARDPLAHIDNGDGLNMELSADQQRVLEPICTALDEGTFCPALLHGVTGSGKTLVYIRAAARALEQGRSSIILVPEIALAWQMVRLFKAHFGDQVAVLHSQLSSGERYDTWRRLRRGRLRLVIGARSAILAPVQNLGLIVVDEEHDASYKQEDLEGSHPLMYNARDVALVRGQRQNAVVVLGSATPSLESYHNVQEQKYRLLQLPRRIDDRPLPSVEVVDMRQEPFQKKQRALFSHALRTRMHARLERGEKIVLLQNRRGFAPFVSCSSCGEAVECDDCRVSLTYHRKPESYLRCHYCDHARPLSKICPSCGSAELRFEGAGTQRVEEALLEQFPGIRVIRMDVDTTGWKGAHDELVESFRRGEADVLLGTQMVAKGLDFPEVTLVGVISADTGMHLPDFRASERSFQLLTQVAGRSGRGLIAGEVVIQTLLPEDPVLRNAARQDYETFVVQELEQRREVGFPPFGRLVVFRWRGQDEDQVTRVAHAGTQHLGSHLKGCGQVLGPAPAPLAQLHGHHRWQALLSGPSPRDLHALTARVLPDLRATARQGAVAMTVNVDPLTMM